MLRGPRLAVLVFLLAAGGMLSLLAVTGEDDPPGFGPVTVDPDEPDPFAYESEREDEFVSRATAGHSHVLYEKSAAGPSTSASTRRTRSRARAATSSSPRSASAARTLPSSRTTWASATWRTC